MRAALALLCLAACGGAPLSGPLPGDRPPGGLRPLDPGTSDPALLSAAACGGCHAAQHAEWRTSRHALAWRNGIFRREFRETPRRWCVHCHAPLAPQVAQAVSGGGPLADEGVGCAACHVRGGRIVAASRRPGSPHDTRVRPGFGGAELCETCHEFSFPVIDEDEQVTRLTALPMQATVSQFRRGPRAASPKGCRSCHAPAGGHAYPGAHDREMLERALEVEACRDGAELVVAITNRGAGHAVPTGDVHRHVNVRLYRSSAPEKLTEIFLGRRFEPDPAGGKRTTWDSGLAPGERRAYRVDPAALGDEGPVRLQVDYVFTVDENPGRGRDPGEPTAAALESRTLALEELPACAPR